MKINGLTIYPIKVAFYERYFRSKAGWAQRQTFLPVKYLFMPFLQALFAYCLDAETPGDEEAPKTAFLGVLDMLALALRLGVTGADLLRNNVKWRFENGTYTLLSIRIVQDGEEHNITPQNFDALRIAVAEMNGIELPDETQNAEILRSYEELKRFNNRNSKPIKPDVADLIETVAYKSGLLYADLLEWDVKDFERRRRAIDRALNYEVFAQAELSGMVSFKKGNPCPSLYFDLLETDYGTSTLKDANVDGLQPKE